jgi:hypothetical protein
MDPGNECRDDSFEYGKGEALPLEMCKHRGASIQERRPGVAPGRR